MNMLPVTYGYARVSKADDDARNLETQLLALDAYGVWPQPDLPRRRQRPFPGPLRLAGPDGRVRPGDTIAVAFLDRLSRNFEEGVRSQAELINMNIGIVAIWENIDTRDNTAAGKYFRRAMLALGAYQVDATSERIKLGLDWARGEGRRIGRPPALSPEQVEQCRRMADEGAGLRQIARVMQCSSATVKKTLVGCQPQSGAPQRQEPLVG